MGYARGVVRAARLERYLWALTLAACGAAPTPVVVAPSQPALSVTENQQGHHGEAEVVATDDDEHLPASQPSIPGVYLWCHAPTGHACRLASAALGTDPKDTRGLPPSLFSVEDLSDDCVEPTIRTIGVRLANAFGEQATGWRDQGGTYLDMASLDGMYSAAGCINDAEPTRPIAKIHAASGSSPRVYLVRVWEHKDESGY
jgi:hypothetical protein